MEHLTIDEIARFVALDRLDNNSLSLASRVNTHILRCGECREMIRTAMGDHGEKPLQKAHESRVFIDEDSIAEEDICVLGVGQDV